MNIVYTISTFSNTVTKSIQVVVSLYVRQAGSNDYIQ